MEKGLLKADHSAVVAIGMDETSVKRGHDYITLFLDLEEKKTIHIAEGKDHRTVLEFATAFADDQGKIEQMRDISCDMPPAFIKGTRKAFPNAAITFDKFHILKLINEAVDAVRRSEAKTTDVLKGARYVVLKNESHLTAKQKKQRECLSQMHLKSMKALQIREAFQEIYKAGSYAEFERLLKQWCFWATHCRLEPIKKVAKTLRKHWAGILRWKESQINNGILEGLNSIIQAAKR